MINPDSREGLCCTIHGANRCIADPLAPWWKKESQRTRRREAEDRLFAMKMIPKGATGMSPPSVNDYGHLLERSVNLFDGSQDDGKVFLDNQLVAIGIDPEKLTGFDWSKYQAIAETLYEMEQRVKALHRQPRKKKEPPVQMEINLLGESGCFAEVVEPNLIADQESIDAVASRDDTDHQMMAMCREALGIREDEWLTLETREDVDRAMKRRNRIVQEYIYITNQYNEIKQTLEGALTAWEYIYKIQLDAYRRMNPPPTGKTLQTLYGDLVLQNAPERVGFDNDNDPNKSGFMAWLETQPPNIKQILNVRTATIQTYDYHKFASWYKGQMEANSGKPPVIAGVIYTPPEKDKFYIRPSLDTVKKQINEQRKEKEDA